MEPGAAASPIPSLLPVLPIRNAVVFPAVSMPLIVGRPRSLRALTWAQERTQRFLIIVTQRTLTAGDPEPADLHGVGTLCRIENVSPNDGGGSQAVVTGISRFALRNVREPGGPEGEELLVAEGEPLPDVPAADDARGQAMLTSLKTLAREILELLPGSTEPLVKLVDRIDDAAYLTHVCSAYLNLSIAQKQELLETLEVDRRLRLLLDHMRREREILTLQREIRGKMAERLNKAQREALLREQLRTIRTELGEESDEETADDLSERLLRARLPPEARKQADDELKRLRGLPAASAEYHVVRGYLETLAAMPWAERTDDRIDLTEARRVLDEDHHGLETVKKRILQYLAVAKLKHDLRGPILCLVGPPGVGKTSLGQSIARALGRRFARTSLGGVRDEAEIRGHRRTYVGAMPGRIVQTIRRAGVRNPLVMLDEIDKLRADFHGDPASAMLEVLDPEQNHAFVDHYLDVPFDLSDVFFIATANVLDTIPGPLRDRMEVIEVNGYTTWEKLRIARDHLLPKELEAHGLRPEQIALPDETLLDIIHHHTREAGVRELRRKLAALLRAAAEELVRREERARPGGAGTAPAADALPDAPVRLPPERLGEILGPERYLPERVERAMRPGVATGLAWTPHGGDLLFLECTRMPGTGQLILTGQLGDVMKESARIALSLARSTLAGTLPLRVDFAATDIHVHVPAGAIPKDGPSAGVPLLAALISLLLGRSVGADLAMTGEITLRGAVLPVGGIKEKVLAAHRAELRTVILPRRNLRDLEDVPPEVRREIRFVPVDTIDDVLAAVFRIRALPQVPGAEPARSTPDTAEPRGA